MAKIDRVLNQREKVAKANKENRRRARIGRSQRGTTKSRKAKSKGKHRKKKVIRTTNEPHRLRAKANTGQDIDINIVTKERRKGGGRKTFAERKNIAEQRTGVRDPGQLRQQQRIASEMLGYTTQTKDPLALTQGRRGRFNVEGGVGGFSQVNPRIQVRGMFDAGLRTGAQETAVRNDPFISTRTQQNIGGGNRLGTNYESPAERMARAGSNLEFDLGRERTRGRNVWDAVITSDSGEIGSREQGKRRRQTIAQRDKRSLLQPRQQMSGFHSETSSEAPSESASIRTPSFTPIPATRPMSAPDIDLGGRSRFVDETGFTYGAWTEDELDTKSTFIPLDTPPKTRPDRQPQPYRGRGKELLKRTLELKAKRERGRRSTLDFDPDEEANSILRRAGIDPDPTPSQPRQSNREARARWGLIRTAIGLDPNAPRPRPRQPPQPTARPRGDRPIGRLTQRALNIKRQREELPLERRYSTRPSGAGELVDATPPSSPDDFEDDDGDFPPSPSPPPSTQPSTPSSFEFDPEEELSSSSSLSGFQTPAYAESPLPDTGEPQDEDEVLRGIAHQVEPEIARLDMPQMMPPEGYAGRSDTLREVATPITTPPPTSPSGRVARRTDRRVFHRGRSDSVLGERRFHPIKAKESRSAGVRKPKPRRPAGVGIEPEIASLDLPQNAGEYEARTNERSGARNPMRSAQFQDDDETQKLRSMVKRLQRRRRGAYGGGKGASFSRRIPARIKEDEEYEFIDKPTSGEFRSIGSGAGAFKKKEQPPPPPSASSVITAPSEPQSNQQRRYGGQEGRQVQGVIGQRTGSEIASLMTQKSSLQEQNKQHKQRLKNINPRFRGALNRFNVNTLAGIQEELARLEEQLSDDTFIAEMTSAEISEVQQLAEDIMRNNLSVRDIQNKLRQKRPRKK